jgi:hypothetical protein
VGGTHLAARTIQYTAAAVALATFAMGTLSPSSAIGQGAVTPPATPGDAVKNLRTTTNPDPGATELSRRIAASHRRRRMEAEAAEQQTKALMAANQESTAAVASKRHKAAISHRAAGAIGRPAPVHNAQPDTGTEDPSSASLR